MRSTTFTVGLTLLVTALSIMCSALPVRAQTPRGTYTEWYWPAGVLTNFRWTVTPRIDQTGPDGYFYAHQFGFENGDGGYAGMQGDNNGKRVVFSIFSADIEVEGSNCSIEHEEFDGAPGSGTSCLIPYDWATNQPYRFDVTQQESTPNGTWWSARVTNASSEVFQIARIKVPSSWGGLSGTSIVWTERFLGDMARCSDIHASTVDFTNFSANDGAISGSRVTHSSYVGSGSCPGSQVRNITGGVRQQMGTGNPLPRVISGGRGTSLSTLSPTEAINEYGPVEIDQSNGEAEANDGHQLSINGQRYTEGLGAHAASLLLYALDGRYTRFTADVGVDDEVGTSGSVTFEVWADGVLLFDIGTLTGADARRSVSVDVTGRQELQLSVTDAADGTVYDHADWANPRLR